MNRVRIQVTQEDIDGALRFLAEGQRGFRSANCPIARAVKRRLPEYANTLAVGPETVTLGGLKRLKLSQRAQQFLNDFDGEKPVRPFTFFGTVITRGDRGWE
jgi:hypothetical protein